MGIGDSVNRSLKKACEELGFQFVLTLVGSAIDLSLADGDDVEEAIIEANEDDTVDGIMVLMEDVVIVGVSDSHPQVYYPIFGGQQVGGYLQSAAEMISLNSTGSLYTTGVIHPFVTLRILSVSLADCFPI